MKKSSLIVMMCVALIMAGLSVYFGIKLDNTSLYVIAVLGVFIFLFFLSGYTYKPSKPVIPALSDEFINKMNQFEHYHSGASCTCNECPLEMSCKYSWDLYNKNGNCLANK